MGATDDHESLVLTRSCIQGFFFFFPADAVTVFGAETTGLAPFSEQARQTGLTTLYWRFISSFTSASGSVLPHLQQIKSKFFARIILLFHWITAWNILAYDEASKLKLPKLKIETFKTTNKRSLTASNEKVITLSVDRDLFGRLFVVAKRRGIKLREIFSYELCCVPVSLVHPDGTLRRQQKAHW